MEWFGTALAILILSCVIGLIIFKLVRDHKKGKHICGGDCSKCHGNCPHSV